MGMSELSLFGRGIIYSVTEISREGAPTGFEYLAPYCVALVDMDESFRVTAMVTDLDLDVKTGALVLPKVGDEVEVVTRKYRDDGDERGLIIYGYKCRSPIEHATPEQIEAINQTIRLAMQGIFE